MPHKDMVELMEDLASRLSVVGCLRCGHIARLGNEAMCPVCRRAEYLYRMRTASEITESAAFHTLAGDERYRLAEKWNEWADAVQCWTDKDD